MGPTDANTAYLGMQQRSGQLSPDLVQAILALSAQKSQEANLQQQLTRAQALRQQGIQGAKQTTYGNGNIAAPNWAGTIAQVLAARKASQMESAAATQQQGMDASRQDALKRYFSALTTRSNGMEDY